MLNTHYYDGKINHTVQSNTSEEVMIKGKALCQLNLKAEALYYLNQIVKDVGTLNNYDPTNKLNADDLICMCWLYKDNVNFLEEFEIQLMDMRSGFCSQGRCHRLYQLIFAFDECQTDKLEIVELSNRHYDNM